jgi:hypothetical protein
VQYLIQLAHKAVYRGFGVLAQPWAVVDRNGLIGAYVAYTVCSTQRLHSPTMVALATSRRFVQALLRIWIKEDIETGLDK